MLLSDLCEDVQEEICSYLSTRDVLALASCCWGEVGQRVLESRDKKDGGISVITRCHVHENDNLVLTKC